MKNIFKEHQRKVKKMSLDKWLSEDKYRQELSKIYKSKNNN